MTELNQQVLSEFDFIVLLDGSGSMTQTDCPRGQTRWQTAQETISAIARALGQFDSDGIDVVLFAGAKVQAWRNVTADKVDEVFASHNPMGSTPLAQALSAGIELAGKSDKKDFILVLTDGVPDDELAARDVILKQANRQENDDDLTILFVQVGQDAAASRYLKMLDDQLVGAKFDIVDALTVAEVEAFPSVTDLIIAAING